MTLEFLRIVPHNTLDQNYKNGSTPPNIRAVRAPDKKYI